MLLVLVLVLLLLLLPHFLTSCRCHVRTCSRAAGTCKMPTAQRAHSFHLLATEPTEGQQVECMNGDSVILR